MMDVRNKILNELDFLIIIFDVAIPNGSKYDGKYDASSCLWRDEWRKCCPCSTIQ